MTGRRFHVTYSNQTIFVDRLRLGCDTDLNRAFLGACAEDPQDVDLHQQPIQFDVPKQDYAAYQRACAAFNAIMDQHEQTIARKNERRRERRCIDPRRPSSDDAGAPPTRRLPSSLRLPGVPNVYETPDHRPRSSEYQAGRTADAHA